MTRSGFCAIIGRPNVGKSTLVNQIVGTKITITSSTPNTTRSNVRGILTEGDNQVVFVDTPGLHRPKSKLGHRLNEAARSGASGVDVICAVVEAAKAIGPGDRAVLTLMLQQCRSPKGPHPIVIVNKVDRTSRDLIAAQLVAANDALREVARDAGFGPEVCDRVEFFPVSAKTGVGTADLVRHVQSLMEEGPWFFPEEEVSDVPEAVWVAELVREQLVRKTKQELPHSIHCRVIEFEWPHIIVEILVERESQKGMVIGKGGKVLKDVGIAARRQLPDGCYLELKVSVEPDWQRKDDTLDRFGM